MARFHATAQGDVPFTAEEEAEWDATEAAYIASADTRKAVEVRTERNTKLAATDWTQASDVPQAIKDSYAPYRQALRDVPSQSGFPWTITWPTQP
jgi:Tfp pilus assembly protein PilW